MKKNTDLLQSFKSGEWIDNLSPTENTLLVDFLKQSLAKQSKRIAFAHKVDGGVLYVVYRVRHRKEDNVLDLIVPGEIYIHKADEDMPKEVANVPRVAFSTISDLGKAIE
jgi:hypothetical protein